VLTQCRRRSPSWSKAPSRRRRARSSALRSLDPAHWEARFILGVNYYNPEFMGLTDDAIAG
jgi:hypothetical protein